MQKRSRPVLSISRKDRLAAYAKEARQKAWHLPPGPEREGMPQKARRAVTASLSDDWAGRPRPRLPN